jgi:hypothetical protein
MIYSDSRICRFCSAAVDHEAAELGARLQEKVNSACNQAMKVRHFAVSMWIFFLISYLLFGVAIWAFRGFLVAIPVWLVSWQITFGKLSTNDPDFDKAKRDRLVAFFVWLSAVCRNCVVDTNRNLTVIDQSSDRCA